MATSTELAQTTFNTESGRVTVTVLDRVSVDRVYLMLLRGAAKAVYDGTSNVTPRVDGAIRDHVVYPFSEL